MKITCDIIRDLLPLYVDDVLSEDSRMLVKTHIQACDDCKNIYEALRHDLDNASTDCGFSEQNIEETKPLKRIRKQIKQRNAKLAILVATLSLIVGFIGFELGANYDAFYVPYEKSGIVMTDGKMYVHEDYSGRYIIHNDNGGVAFIYLTDTFFTLNKEMKDDEKTEVKYDFLNPPDRNISYSEVYYITEENVKTLSKLPLMNLTKEQEVEITNSIKEGSVLIWKNNK